MTTFVFTAQHTFLHTFRFETVSVKTYELIKIQMVLHPSTALIKLIHEAHDVKSVQGIHDGGAHVLAAKYASSVATFAYWTQFILAPGISFVPSPGM